MTTDVSVKIGNEEIKFSTGYYAKQADGAVMVTLGETVIFASAVMSKTVREGQDFFPLTVDYREKAYSAGKIPGGFIKRESRPSDRETLICRITDRPLRPLFPKGFINEVQVILYVLSADKENQQDVVAINAASAALSISGMPFHGPVGAVRVGRVNGEWIANPTFAESEESDIDIVVAGTKKAVTMIEGLASNVSEDDMLGAVEFAHENIKKICEVLEELKEKAGKKAIEYTTSLKDEDLKAEIKKKYYSELETLSKYTVKLEREDAFKAIVSKVKEELADEFSDVIGQVKDIIDGFDGEIVRNRILESGDRADGRKLNTIRPIDIKTGMLPRTHGSAVFTRGETQSLGITTLGSLGESQRLDNIEGETRKRFMLHYNFPPFCVGETGRVGGVGRREIGHGMLAERALEYVIPDEKDFPYTIRQVSEVFESNGSSSMATVCSGSLAMMDAGIPIKAAVAGIAMGLVMEGDNYAVLSDIQGLEDHLGDMDFKVAGTKDGITAFQLDIKIEGITLDIMKVALSQAKEGRLHMLGEMDKVLKSPKEVLSDHAPKIKQIKVNPDKIGGIIGQGGKTIKKIIEETGAEVNIEDDGSVSIASSSNEAIEKAVKYISVIVDDVEPGQIYDVKIVKMVDFGAFAEIVPGKEGLIHISNLAKERVRSATDVVSLGDIVKVKVLKVDDRGRIDLSRKDAIQE